MSMVAPGKLTFWWDTWRDILMRHLTRHFDETFWWDIMMRHYNETLQWDIWIDIVIRHFDETFLWDTLMRHFDETFEDIWWDILMRNLMRYFDKTFWWDFLMRHLIKHFYHTFWGYILIRHLVRHSDETFLGDILIIHLDCNIFMGHLMRHLMKFLAALRSFRSLAVRRLVRRSVGHSCEKVTFRVLKGNKAKAISAKLLV